MLLFDGFKGPDDKYIIPQAICTHYGLTIRATVAPLVQLLLWLFFPIACPISKALDWMLGKGYTALLQRAELKTFVDFHGSEAGKGGDLTHDETTIITGALELMEKTAKDAMTPISKAFSLDLDGPLNFDYGAFICVFVEYVIHSRDIPKYIEIGYVRMRYGALLWDYGKRKLEAGIKDNTTEKVGRLFGKEKRKRKHQE
ncbi:DUF21 domain-containing protein [Capsicum baccatum]|uniref:DUF21 domain-containing protein n=1 Tax=Capsicum baccatum TaxID=33114 RepID=A0A2G2WYB8_CAPBA|nr:DUF21 domain-containing protein [Capsicum baccatum]